MNPNMQSSLVSGVAFSRLAQPAYRGRAGCHMSAHHRIRRSSPFARERFFDIRHTGPAR
jgi:hypothetical protein